MSVRARILGLGLGVVLVVGADAAAAGPTYFGLAGQVGAFGTSDGQFQGLTGAATDADGNLYVADSQLLRVQKFSPSGEFLLKWGNPTPTDSLAPGQFQSIRGVAVDRIGGFVYVTDGEANRVQKFTLSGQLVATWGRNGGDGSAGTGAGEFTNPSTVTVDSTGVVYVVDGLTENPQWRVQRFKGDGTVLGQFTASQFWALTTDGDGNLYALFGGRPQVVKMSPTGQQLVTWGKSGTKVGELGTAPSGLAFDASTGNIWVADSTNYRLQEFTPSGKFVLACGDYGVSRGLTVAPNGDTYAGGQYWLTRFAQVSTPARPCDQTKPSISGLTIAPRQLTLPPPRAARSTLLLRYRLSEDAQVRVVIERATRGRRVGTRCLPARPGQTRGRCTRWLKQADRRAFGRRGANSTRIAPRRNGKWLAAGIYRARAVATDNAGYVSRPRSARFTVAAD